MSSKFQSLRDFKKNKKNKVAIKNILLMKDGYTPYNVSSTYYKKSTISRRHSNLYRCVLTGRSKFVLTKYRLTRMAFKSLSSSGLIPGSKKSSH